MRNIAIALLFACSLSFSQEYNSVVLFDMAGVTSDSITSVSIKNNRGGNGVVVEIDFTSVNCDLLTLDIGYGLSDIYPLFVDTVPNLQMPVLLDKTEYTSTYKGIENSSISFDMIFYSANYLWVRVNDNAACTSGEIKLRYKR